MNAAGAARRAGYSIANAADQGTDLMKREDVMARIDELMQERVRRIGVNQDYVLNGLLDITRAGSETGRLKAFELLGKHQHMFNEQLDVNLTLARKAEEYAKLPKEQQIALMEAELKRMKSNEG